MVVRLEGKGNEGVGDRRCRVENEGIRDRK